MLSVRENKNVSTLNTLLQDSQLSLKTHHFLQLCVIQVMQANTKEK